MRSLILPLLTSLAAGSHLFDFSTQMSLDISFKDVRTTFLSLQQETFFKGLGKADPFFKHLFEESSSSYLIPGQDDMVELVCSVPIERPSPQRDVEGTLKLGAKMTEATKFQELDKSLGLKLLQPLQGKCFSHVSFRNP